MSSAQSEMERRREARRRKILENSQSRMNKLYGREEASASPTQDSPVADIGAADPILAGAGPAEECPDPPDPSVDELLGRGPLSSALLGGHRQPGLDQLLFSRPVPGASNLSGNTTTHMGGVRSGFWGRWDRCRPLLIALLALLTNFCLVRGLGDYVGQNVLVPFLVLECTVYVVYMQTVPLRPNMGLLGTALMLCGVPSHTLDLWGRYIAFLSHVWSDLMTYMFVTVLSYHFLAPGGGDTRQSLEGRPPAAPPSPAPEPPPDDVEFDF